MAGNLVWLENKRRRKGENPKLQPKFVGPYEVLAAWGSHTYRIERQGQQSVQHESRLKPYRACNEPSGRAPATLEAARRPNMKGAATRARKEPVLPEAEPEPLPVVVPPARPEVPRPEVPVEPTEAMLEMPRLPEQEATVGSPSMTENGPETRSQEMATRSSPHTTPGVSRPQRTRQPPQRYGEFYCHYSELDDGGGQELRKGQKIVVSEPRQVSEAKNVKKAERTAEPVSERK